MARLDSDHLPVDFDALIGSAKRDRHEAMGKTMRRMAEAIPISRRDVSVACAASLVSVGLFWTVMLTDPPTTEANTPAAAAAEAERARLLQVAVSEIEPPKIYFPCEALTNCP